MPSAAESAPFKSRMVSVVNEAANDSVVLEANENFPETSGVEPDWAMILAYPTTMGCESELVFEISAGVSLVAGINRERSMHSTLRTSMNDGSTLNRSLRGTSNRMESHDGAGTRPEPNSL